MALDNAQFISELSVIDPPGTDPLNQGDDHIRTTKLAVQQSFPNVGSAVPQTGVQMAQMAIKNEVNVFTVRQEFSANLRLINDADRGLQWNHTNGNSVWELLSLQSASDDFHLGRYVGGVFQDAPISVENALGNVLFPNQALHGEGTNLLPSISFSADRDTGFFGGGNTIGMTAAGVQMYAANNTQQTWTGTASIFRRDIGRLLMQDTAGANNHVQMGLLSNNAGFFEMNDNNGNPDFLMRTDSGGQNYIMGSATQTGNRRLGIGTISPGRTVHINLPANSADDTPLRLTGLPTSNLTLSSGDVWNSGNFLAIVP